MNFLFYKNEIDRQDKTEILLKIEKKNNIPSMKTIICKNGQVNPIRIKFLKNL
jgi:hypothetical protein